MKLGQVLREFDLTLNKAIDICGASELTQTHPQSLHEEVGIPVHKVIKQNHSDKWKDINVTVQR